MEYILDNKGLLEVVLGSEMRPDTSGNDQQIWDKKDKEARQLIVMCVNEDQDNYLYGAKTACEMWAKLSSVYQEKSTANSLQLKSRFYSLKKASEDSMVQHINKMVELLEELRALGIKVPEEDSIMVLLNSLPDAYRMVKVALRTHEGLTFEKVSARLREAETELEPTEKKKEKAEESAYVSNHKTEQKSSGKNKEKTCFKCQKVGHIAKECKSKGSEKITCFKCGKVGHKSTECKTESKSNAFMVGAMKMEEKGPAKSRSREPWIIDSGASHHLCYKKEEFSELRELSSPTKIVLGDNRVIEATHEGRVDLDLRVGGEIQSATLSKVLYVPEIKKNLFSVVSCVAAGNNLRFTEKGVQIFNNRKKLVGLGYLRDGLWHLKCAGGLHYANMANSAENASIWHRRLGHLTAQNLQLLKTKSLVKGLEEVDFSGLENCEGCLHGKAN